MEGVIHTSKSTDRPHVVMETVDRVREVFVQRKNSNTTLSYISE
jgi:hypothetical protein